MSRQLGALSGLAIILIVLNHAIHMGINVPLNLGYPALPEWQSLLLSVLQALGAFAVPTFLFISGSFIAYAARGDPPAITRKFITTSLRHILIPYFIWSIVFYILVFLQYGESNSVMGYLKSLAVGYPYHFIPLLVIYYLLSPILVIIGRRYAVPLLLVILGYQLVLVNILDPGFLGFSFPEWSSYLVPPVIGKSMADWAIFFPLGLLIGLHSKTVTPWLKKYAVLIAFLTILTFAVALLNAFTDLEIPQMRVITPMLFVCLIPAIRRDVIPFARFLERVGRRSYGVYLIHLLIIDITLWFIQIVFPSIFNLPIVLFPLLFIMGLFVPLWGMELTAKAPTKRFYRYVFG